MRTDSGMLAVKPPRLNVVDPCRYPGAMAVARLPLRVAKYAEAFIRCVHELCVKLDLIRNALNCVRSFKLPPQAAIRGRSDKHQMHQVCE